MEIAINLGDPNTGWTAPATVAQILVAGATLALAFFTLRSVRAASRSAEATIKLAEAAEKEVSAAHHQNELAEETLLASIQPVLSDYPRRPFEGRIVERSAWLPDDWVPWAGSEEKRKARLRSMHMWSNSMLPQAPEGETAWGITTLFRNVGNGVAVVEHADLELGGKMPNCQIRISKLLIPRDDYCRVTFNIANRDFPDPLKSGSIGTNYAKPDFFVDISYANANGTGKLRTRQRIQIVRGNPHIAAIEIWDQESGKLLAVSEYSGFSAVIDGN